MVLFPLGDAVVGGDAIVDKPRTQHERFCRMRRTSRHSLTTKQMAHPAQKLQMGARSSRGRPHRRNQLHSRVGPQP